MVSKAEMSVGKEAEVPKPMSPAAGRETVARLIDESDIIKECVCGVKEGP
jgi:hypothetical protein